MKRQICLRDLSNQRDLSQVPPLTKIKVSLEDEGSPSQPQAAPSSESTRPSLLSIRQHDAGISRGIDIDVEVDDINTSQRPNSSKSKDGESNVNINDSSSSSSNISNISNSSRISSSSSSHSNSSSGISSQISPRTEASPERLTQTVGGHSPGRENGSPNGRPSLDHDLDRPTENRGPANEDEDAKDDMPDVKQLNKLKRFLTTLQQFAFDISPEIGEKVRGLVLALVNSQIPIEEFHSKLQQATNFPLRPFVVPFLKANLPLLQRELLQTSPPPCIDRGSGSRPPSANSRPRTESTSIGARISTIGGPYRCSTRASGSSVVTPSRAYKHALPLDDEDRFYEIQPKRSPPNNHHSPPTLLNLYDVYSRSEISRSGQREQDISPTNTENAAHRMEEEWKYVDDLLRRIAGMVERCKETISSWEYRRKWLVKEVATRSTQPPLLLSHSESQHLGQRASSLSTSLRNPATDLADTARQMDEIVREVRLQAVTELQKAVATAELSAAQTIAVERVKMERTIDEVRIKARQEALAMLNRQRDSTEACLNCGREAHETCSGCRVARYCGQFCQLRHWEVHHRVCGKTASTSSLSATSNSSSFPFQGIQSKNGKKKQDAARRGIEPVMSGLRESRGASSLDPRRSSKSEITRSVLSPKVVKQENLSDEGDESITTC